MKIRPELATDYFEVEALTREAFWNLHVPGCDEHLLVHLLREHCIFLPELDFVALAEDDTTLTGNIMYAKALLRDLAGAEYEVISFGPVSVLPDYQSKGIGSALIRHSLDLAREQGHKAPVFIGAVGAVSAVP